MSALWIFPAVKIALPILWFPFVEPTSNVKLGDVFFIPTLPVLKYIFDPIVVHCEPDIKFKLPLLSILNWAVLYFKDIIFDVFKKGSEKVRLFVYSYLLYLMSHLHKFLKA